MPTYNNNVPVANQTIASSQPEINTNFASIQTLIDVNHNDFGDALFGKHKFVEMPNQSSNPAGATNEMTLYSKQYTSGATTQSEAFVLRDALAGPNTPIPFTATANVGNGWTFLPSGIMIKWGFEPFSIAPGLLLGDLPVVFPSGPGFPAFTNIWSIQTTFFSGSNISALTVGNYVRILSTTGFTQRLSNSTGSTVAGNLYYIAIGSANP